MTTAVLTMSGDIDHTNTNEWYSKAELTLRPTVSELTLDMSNVRSLDPTAISMLVGISRLAAQDHADVTIRNPTARVMRLLAMNGMSDYFPIDGGPSDPLGLTHVRPARFGADPVR